MEALRNLAETWVANIEPEVLAIIVVAVIALIVISLIKKVIKLAITIVVIALVLGAVVPTVSGLKEEYNVQFEENTVSVDIQGNTVTLDFDAIDRFVVTDNGDDTYTVEIHNEVEDGFSKVELSKVEYIGLRAIALIKGANVEMADTSE